MASPSCPCHFAEAFKGIPGEELMQKITHVWEDFENFPYWSQKISWEVIMLSKGYFTHYSLLFTTPGNNEGFVIHLSVGEHNEITFLFEKMADISSRHTLKKTELGTTKPAIDAVGLIMKAHDILVQMGSYHETFNNCQDYCQIVAKELGVSSPMTGTDVVEAAVGVGTVGAAVGVGILGAAAYLLYKLSKDDKKEK